MDEKNKNGGGESQDPNVNNNNANANTNPAGSEPGKGGDDKGQQGQQGQQSNQQSTDANTEDGKGNSNNGAAELTEEQWQAAFNHPRFKELNEKAKKADELEKKAKDDEQKKLQEQGKYQELATKETQAREAAENALNTERKRNAVMAAATKAGAVDPEAAFKLVDNEKLEVSENGAISGVDDAIKNLQESSPYLFSQSSGKSVGSESNPQQGGETEFTYSQVADPKFYNENQEAVDKAIKEGRVDMNK